MNSLACVRFASAFGRQAVHAISITPERENEHKHLPTAQEESTLFGETIDLAFLSRKLADGGEFKCTQLTEDFDFGALTNEYPGLISLLYWGEDKLYE